MKKKPFESDEEEDFLERENEESTDLSLSKQNSSPFETAIDNFS
jgi:hypothetical protein